MKNPIFYTDLVYVVECNNLYKIGHTSQLDSRLTALQNGTPFAVKLIHAIPHRRNKEVERALHAMFADQRVRGEWFKLSMRDIAKIKSLSVEQILATVPVKGSEEWKKYQMPLEFEDDE